MFCKIVIEHNIKNMTNWHFVNKYYADLPQELYENIMNHIIELPLGNFDQCKCVFHSDKYKKCTECNILICSTHANVWNCLKCDLILCKDCFHENSHTSHTSWSYMDYEI